MSPLSSLFTESTLRLTLNARHHPAKLQVQEHISVLVWATICLWLPFTTWQWRETRIFGVERRNNNKRLPRLIGCRRQDCWTCCRGLINHTWYKPRNSWANRTMMACSRLLNDGPKQQWLQYERMVLNFQNLDYYILGPMSYTIVSIVGVLLYLRYHGWVSAYLIYHKSSI
jgi:hypothetical protein